ncbi:hypothetical protein DFH06DRAFT_1104631 [Mycena polygramma]|nr:hypothetical protein DFH06DRAFT_1104631 [Mycena polygramma]
MVLKILTAASGYFPSEYTVHIVATLIAVLATRRIAQGRWTTRERDMHARVVVVTGGFTPLGLTLLESLAHRGAHIIALTPHPVSSPLVSTYIDLLRSTTSNENIYAETCDLASPPSIHAFAARFVTGDNTNPTTAPPRLDALVCAHEYAGVGALPQFARGGAKGREAREREQRARDEGALASFLLATLLLPAMLTAPVERDIRIVHVVNRFYAAAAPRFFADGRYVFPDLSAPLPPSASPTSKSQLRDSPLLAEATRALRTVLLTRHLQRVLDALPSAPVPNPSDGSSTATGRVANQKSNIVAVSVSPGLSRAETVAPLFGYGEEREGEGRSWWGRLFYILLYPLLFLLTKSASATLQSVLHVLFLPTPVKSLQIAKSEKPTKADANAEPEEALKPGALYAECAVVRVGVPGPSSSSSAPMPTSDSTAASTGLPDAQEGDANSKGKGKAAEATTEIELPDDGELGGEAGGRAVWEAYEAGLRGWEAGFHFGDKPKEET